MAVKKAANVILRIDLGVQTIFWMVNTVIFSISMDMRNMSMTFLAVLMLLNGILFGYFALFERKRVLANDYILLAFLLINTVLTVTDNLGVFDYVILALNLLAVCCCILASNQFFKHRKSGNDG